METPAKFTDTGTGPPNALDRSIRDSYRSTMENVDPQLDPCGWKLYLCEQSHCST